MLSLLFHDVYERDPAESGFSGAAADGYKLTVAEFEAQLAGLAGVLAGKPMLVTESSHGNGAIQPFLITVDDGGVSYYTRIADRLEALGWRGHCFISTGFTGRRGFLSKRQIRELDARGHVIGSHSVTHPKRFSACCWNELIIEWRESCAALSEIVGHEIAAASVPGGFYSSRVARAAGEAGLRWLFTSEPETGVRPVGGCMVLGRFTIRRGHDQDFSRRLGLMKPFTLGREWMVWNSKKIVKGVLGTAYPHFMDCWRR
ncbi:MAG: polysaccharide deacetylase family protein [Nitrospirae bacterium]|nr:polysaccharide deacetylase family protein [Nitrospirota bacterium]